MRPVITEIVCQCGEVQGQIDSVTPKSSIHLTCHCKYCRGFAVHLGQAERLVDDTGASDLLQVAPAGEEEVEETDAGAVPTTGDEEPSQEPETE